MRILLVALLLLAGCAPVPSSHPAGPSGLTAEEEAALNNAAEFLSEDSEEGTPLSEEELSTYPEARGMPADVQRFMVRWQGCQHWLGEPDWDAARRRQIEQAVREACPGIDAEGRRIRALYAGYPEVLARLRDYEPLGQ